MTEASAAETLSISSTTDASGVLVALEGELDVATASLLADCLDEIHAESPAQLTIDLRQLEFMDSSGLRILVAARESARQSEYPIVLRPGSGQVQRLLTLTGVIGGFTVVA